MKVKLCLYENCILQKEDMNVANIKDNRNRTQTNAFI